MTKQYSGLIKVTTILIGIERVKAKDKYGHLYLALPLVIAIILVVKFMTKI